MDGDELTDIPVGTWVKAWPGFKDKDTLPVVRRTRTPVWRLATGTEVVSVEGLSGGIALSHIEVIHETKPKNPAWQAETKPEP